MNTLELFKIVWLKPRIAVNKSDSTNLPNFLIYLIIYLAGISYGINRAELKSVGDSMELNQILVMIVFASGFGGLITYHIMIWLTNLSASRFFNGTGSFENTRKAYVLSMVPSLVLVGLGIISILLFGLENFQEFTPRIDSSVFLTSIFWIFGVLGLILGIWKIYILINTISEVQGISNWKAVFSIIIGFFIFAIPIIILLLLYFS